MIKIGFDIGGIISKYPHLLRPIIIALLSSKEIEVHILSDMRPHDKCVKTLIENGFNIPSSQIHSCDYEKYGGECKAIKAKEIGLDILIDDFPDYVGMIGAPELRLLAMPDPTKDYYHKSWKTDGSEGNFGRRKK